MNSTTQVPTNASEYRVWVNQVSPNLKDFNFYKAKKGDKVSIINSFVTSVSNLPNRPLPVPDPLASGL